MPSQPPKQADNVMQPDLAHAPEDSQKSGHPLTPGTTLGSYEIIAALGAGGMGEVFRARDTRLDRSVAIKILPAAVAADRDRLRRFEQEARLASALNHPNIVTIHELGQDGSTHYIVMELIEGQTLGELLAAGVLPIRTILEIAAQVAEGLAKAHEAGIAHRDLKPGNVMVSDDGFVKILDFGLAKLAPLASELSETRNLPRGRRQPGQMVGTLQYMSPEQAGRRPGGFPFRPVLVWLGAVRNGGRENTLLREARQRRHWWPFCGNQPNRSAVAKPRRPRSTVLGDRPLSGERARQALRLDSGSGARAGSHTRPLRGEAGSAGGDPPRRIFPCNGPRFVGREKEVAAAKELLLRQDVRLVTITGPGGIGKTRLAVEVAGGLVELLSRRYSFYAALPAQRSGLDPSAIVQTLGIREAGSQSPLEILKKNLQDSLRAPMLLLLDNFEHLIQAAPTVSELLAMAPHLKILVTSRAALHVYGEHEFPAPPLALPDSRSLPPPLEVLSKYSAVALFVQRAIAARPDFELNRENAGAVTAICARLDGLPLAIELAAARVKVLSLSAILTRLASRLQLLTGGARDLPERQQTLRGAIDWSYDLLSPAEQKLFRRLSVFVDGCDLEGVEAVCDTKGDLDLDLLDGMASMVDKSLLQQIEQADGELRFVMLETIREYALEKLEAAGEQASTKRAHAAYCLVLAEEDAAEQSAAEEMGLLERFALEHDNFRAALEWLTETADAEWGLRLGTALFRFWETREFFAEGRDRLDKLLRLPGAAGPMKARTRALFAAGVLTGAQGDYGSAEALLGESLEIARQLGDKQGAAVSLNALAVNARERGDVAVAHALFEESLMLWTEWGGDQKAVARALSNLASVVKLQGDFARARSLYADCLSIFQRLGDRTGVAWSLNSQGDVARDQGDCAAAQALYEQSLAIFRETGDRWGIAGTLADLGNLAREQRNYPVAQSLYRESIRLFLTLEHKRGIARLLECFACSAAVQLEAESALRLAGAAAALRRSIGAPLTPAEQSKLEAILDLARQVMNNMASATAWWEGWAGPVDKAIQDVLTNPPSSLP